MNKQKYTYIYIYIYHIYIYMAGGGLPTRAPSRRATYAGGGLPTRAPTRRATYAGADAGCGLGSCSLPEAIASHSLPLLITHYTINSSICS